MNKFLIILLFSAAFAASGQHHKQDKPNIIFILSNDVGYGDLSCYGAKAMQTPNIDNLASKGIRFTHAYACSSICTPPRYGLLSGQYPRRRNDTGIARGDAPIIIRPDQKTVASVLKDALYVTGVVGKWHPALGEWGFKRQAWNDSITPGPKQTGFDYSIIMTASGNRL
jgi:arylsulfatase A-like enzyme